jgi:hypothetical protein
LYAASFRVSVADFGGACEWARSHRCNSSGDYGFGLDVLGLIVEQITEQSLGRYICRRTCGSRSA